MYRKECSRAVLQCRLFVGESLAKFGGDSEGWVVENEEDMGHQGQNQDRQDSVSCW